MLEVNVGALALQRRQSTLGIVGALAEGLQLGGGVLAQAQSARTKRQSQSSCSVEMEEWQRDYC